jgi:hypothetical protein
MLQKTKVLTLIVFGLIFLNLSAQEDNFGNDKAAKLPSTDRKVRMGLHFSPNLSWLKANTTGYEGDGNKFGFSYGLSVEYFLNENSLFSSGIDLLYASGNIKYKGTTQGVNGQNYAADINQEFNVRYIDIPITLKLKTNEIGYLSYYGQFGLKTGFNYKANSNKQYTYLEATTGFPTTTSESIKDAKGEINFINMCLVIGVGVEYNISGNTTLSLGVTFNNGFINQLDSKQNLIDSNGNAVIDANGNPAYSDKDASANLNYVALNIGIYF